MPDKEKSFEEVAKEGLSWLDGSVNDHLKSIHDRIDQRTMEPQTKMPSGNRWWVWVLALILALLATWLFIESDTNEGGQDGSELFAANYEKFPNVLDGVTRSDDDNEFAGDSLRALVKYYEMDQPELALSYIPRRFPKDQEDFLDFYTGMTYLELGQSEVAVEYLQKTIDSENDGLSQAAQWYAGLAFLNMGDMSSASRIMEKISEDSGHYQKGKADALLKSLK